MMDTLKSLNGIVIVFGDGRFVSGLQYYQMKDEKGVNKVKIDLIVIGNPNSGKTSLIKRFIQGQTSFTHFYTPTLGLSLQKKVIHLDGNEVTVCIWDTAGQQKFFSLTKSYFKKADGVLVVFDLTDKVSFDRVDKFWIPEIKEKSDQNCPQILIGNKRDMIGERTVATDSARQLAQQVGLKYFQTSAKTGEGVDQSIQYLVKQCLTKINSQDVSEGFGLQRPPGKQSTSCVSSLKGFFSDIRNKLT